MAQNADFQKRLCVVWDTEASRHGQSYKSSTFSLMGTTSHLFMYKYSDFHIYTIYLKFDYVEKDSKGSFRVITFIGGNRSVMPFSCSTTINLATIVGNSCRNICDFSTEQIKKSVPDFHFTGRWNIVCTFHFESASASETRNNTIHVSTQTYLDVPPDLENLSLDVSNLLKDEVFPDVKLRCGDRTISAHRSILAGRSQVFAAMFRNKMVESETGIVDVTDLDVSILEVLLKYAYSGKITGLSDDIASSLYEAADKYAMHALKNTCSDWMIGNLTEDNCLGFLTVAGVHEDAAFKDAVFSFINCHPEVIYSDIWSRFSEEHPKLANAAYRSYFMSTRK